LLTTPQDSTKFETPSLLLAFELGGSKWQLGFAVNPAGPVRYRTLPTCDAPELLEQVLAEVAAARARFRLDAAAPVFSCYEAGRDGFWLHRALTANSVENVIVEPASLLVDRRARRAKTDRLDLQSLLGSLFRHRAGEKVWRVVNAPAPDVEDLRRIPRARARLVKERTQHINRIKSLLNQEGVKTGGPAVQAKAFANTLGTLTRFDGSPLGPRLLSEIRHQLARLRLVQDQVKELEDEQKALLAAPAPSHPVVDKARRLTALKGIGPVTAFVLSAEFFGWRAFRNRRQVGSLAGLTDTPWKSDGIDRQQGISKAGNARVRSLAIELAWNWRRWQPDSDLSRWFDGYVGDGLGGRKRFKRVAIVALARKLLVALWRYLEHGLVPNGAIMTPPTSRAQAA
jgi:transposase